MSLGYFGLDSQSSLRDGVSVSEESSQLATGDEGVGNISNHHSVTENDLSSDCVPRFQCGSVSDFQKLNIYEFHRTFYKFYKFFFCHPYGKKCA